MGLTENARDSTVQYSKDHRAYVFLWNGQQCFVKLSDAQGSHMRAADVAKTCLVLLSQGQIGLPEFEAKKEALLRRQGGRSLAARMPLITGTSTDSAEPPKDVVPPAMSSTAQLEQPKPAQDDAPPGHPAHSQVRFCPHSQGHLYEFKYKGQHVQVTVGKACNSPEDAARIARLCYMKFEEGISKEEVIKYRNGLLKELEMSWSNKAMPVKNDGSASSSAALTGKRRRNDGAVGASWASQLGSRWSKARKEALQREAQIS
mmetsp:Transcript_54326/g.129458  ORF Transcript_54326/g.129458 Transcript_54326/m.129458 type:complete len:260 (+) Transcript_54326:111-890(+)|eukprot:CAMPEP_0178411838 /NCGR_PEP_ID=MMETSP0689_2-20121128/21701_1 /TAXON_ID=160604 /ORGANISM="Amphidinium massartii, Strain CS-259" /LENGTH=259 /DNA_ID=CAMNT_0020033057 /DNA_START=76 /DNA_END=855 /DNA_ORIENTATION=-